MAMLMSSTRPAQGKHQHHHQIQQQQQGWRHFSTCQFVLALIVGAFFGAIVATLTHSELLLLNGDTSESPIEIDVPSFELKDKSSKPSENSLEREFASEENLSLAETRHDHPPLLKRKFEPTKGSSTVQGRHVDVYRGYGPPASKVSLAYCSYENAFRSDYPNTEAYWVAREFAKGLTHLYEEIHLFSAMPEEKYFEYRKFPKIKDEDMWFMLGLDADFRFCWFGQTSLMQTIIRIKKAAMMELSVDIKQKNMWTSDAKIFQIPKSISYIGDPKTKKPVGPVHIRMSFEPWAQFVNGVQIQLDTKRENLAPKSISFYFPSAFISIGRRVPMLLPDKKEHSWVSTHGCCIPKDGGVEEAVFRHGLFDPQQILHGKKHFASFIQSHCHTYRHTTAIRTAFAFELARLVKPVSGLGRCPKDNASEMLGMSPADRVNLRNHYNGYSSVDMHHDHKFAIVFENGPCDGYITEKVIDSYLAASVPVYFGPDKRSLSQVLNPEAYIHCDIPADVSNERLMNAAFSKMCSKRTPECDMEFDSKVQKDLEQYFRPCIDRIKQLDENDTLYKQMISAPLVAHGELGGIWNVTFWGEALIGARSFLQKQTTNPDEVKTYFKDQDLPSYYFS